jgi:hypothetical protein
MSASCQRPIQDYSPGRGAEWSRAKSLPGYSEGAEYFRREGVDETQGREP